MHKSVRQGIVKYLAVVSLAASSYTSANARPSLSGVPERLVSELIDEVEEPTWTAEKRKRVLQLVARDPRPAVRARVAEAAAALFAHLPSDAEQLLRQLAEDRSRAVRNAAQAALTKVLDSAHPPERLRLLADWVHAPSTAQRAAAASALCSPTPLFMTDFAIELLAADTDRQVRRLAMKAAAAHFHESPPAYTAIALGLSEDPDRWIRRKARRLLQLGQSAA